MHMYNPMVLIVAVVLPVASKPAFADDRAKIIGLRRPISVEVETEYQGMGSGP